MHFCAKFLIMDTLNKIIELFTSLDFPNKIKAIEELSSRLETEREKIINDTITDSTINDETGTLDLNCPHCMGSDIIKWGKNKTNERYKCRGCNRTFSHITGSPAHNIKKKNNWVKFGKELFNGQYFTLEELAKRTGISVPTAFDWRNKLLCSLNDSNKNFEGITEIDDIWFLYSQKGRKGLKYSRKRGGTSHRGDNDFRTKVLITSDRMDTLDMSVVRIGRLQKQDIVRSVGDKLSDKTTLVSDKHQSIAGFAKDAGIPHISFKANTHCKDKDYHVQTVNNIAGRFKTMVNRKLRGVSTKYLQNYANWFRINEKYKAVQDNVTGIIKESMLAQNTWDRYVNTERLYSNFIKNFSQRTYRCPTKRSWKSQNWNYYKVADA